MDEAQLLAKLRLLEALHAGTSSEGERDAAKHAAERIRYYAKGELTQRGATSYACDAFGHLVSVTEGSTVITYTLDGLGRRIGRTKMVSGTVVSDQRWLYGHGLNPVAAYDGAGNLVAQFVYATERKVPDVVLVPVSGGGLTAYQVVTDHLGNVRAVVKTAGATSVAEALVWQAS